jgi:FkbM family methyltransferase
MGDGTDPPALVAGSPVGRDGRRSPPPMVTTADDLLARVPFPLRRWWWDTTVRAVLARRHLSEFASLERHLPWSWWCRLCAAGAPTVVRSLGNRASRPLTFVQIGANDGVRCDPLHETVITHHWRGVLVEPIPDLFERLVENYPGASTLTFENAALGTTNGSITLWVVRPRMGDPDWADQLASFDKEVVLRHRNEVPQLDDRLEHVEVESLTLPTLVRRHDLQTIDLLHVDAEGFDLQVLDQVDLTAEWAPRSVIFEKKHLEPVPYRKTLARYRRAGYRRVNLWPDELLYRPSPWR